MTALSYMLFLLRRCDLSSARADKVKAAFLGRETPSMNLMLALAMDHSHIESVLSALELAAAFTGREMLS